jgi:hypothetical protein
MKIFFGSLPLKPDETISLSLTPASRMISRELPFVFFSIIEQPLYFNIVQDNVSSKELQQL